MTEKTSVNYVWARLGRDFARRGPGCLSEGMSYRKSEGHTGMEHFWEILTKPDNLPIVGMLLAVIFCLGVAFRQALKHDKLIAQGKKDEIYSEMSK